MDIIFLWLAIGYGVWLGLIFPDYNTYCSLKFRYIFFGYISTLLLWPVALHNNYNKNSRESKDD